MTKCGGLESRRMNSNPPSRLEKLNLKPVVMKAETQFALRIPKGFVPQDLAAPAISGSVSADRIENRRTGWKSLRSSYTHTQSPSPRPHARQLHDPHPRTRLEAKHKMSLDKGTPGKMEDGVLYCM